jgi:putative PIN family toxin of toxin-antitoxin system
MPKKIVLDTNIVLDVLVFTDPAAKPVLQGLRNGSLQWIATAAMREELERVLAYPNIAKRLAYYQLQAAEVLARFDALTMVEAAAPKASVTCKDADDQKFIDLGVAHRACILSKDHAVLCMKKRLQALQADCSEKLSAQLSGQAC